MMSVDTEQSDSQWTKLTVLQLKGALVRRGLNNEGTKPELIARLSEYEQLNKSTKDESMEEDQEVKGEVKATYLDKRKIRDVYEACRSLRTVLINPFKADVFEHESARNCLMDCSSFVVKNMPNGNKVAEMWFDTMQKGQECCTELSSALTDCEVAHPKLKCKLDCDQVEKLNLAVRTNFIKQTEHVGFPEFMIPSSHHDLWGKIVILEGMSQEMNTEAILRDFFPEAEVHLPFDFDQAFSRFAVLVFGTQQAAKQYLELVGAEPVPLQEGVDVKVTLQPNYWKDTANSIYTAEMEEKQKKRDEHVKKEILTDEERLTLVQEVADIVEFVESHREMRIESMANVQENIKAFQEMVDELKEKKIQLFQDAELRKARGDTEMPEPLKEKLKSDEVNVEEVTKELTELRILREKAYHEHHHLNVLVEKTQKKLKWDKKNERKNDPFRENNAATKGKDSFNKKKKLQQLEQKKRKISLNEPVRGSQGHYRVFIYGLPTDVEETVVISELMRVFKKSGGFIYIKLLHNKGKGYLTVKSKKDWENALALQGTEISGKTMQVGDGSDQDESKWLKEDKQQLKKPTGKKDQKRKANEGITCHKCGGAGHMQRECRATGIAFGQPASKKGRMDRSMNKGAYNMMDNFSSTLNRMEQIGQMLGQSPYGNMGTGMSNAFGSSSASGGNAFGSNSYNGSGYGGSSNNGYGNDSYGSYSNYANKSNSYSNKAYGYNN